MIARPPTNLRLIGLGCELIVGSDPYVATKVIMSPSARRICASLASHKRAAFSETASITGRRSVGELEMTWRISLVAVCCFDQTMHSALSCSVFSAL